MESKKIAPGHQTIDFPVVGVGASAGGLEAFQKLLRNIPMDSGMAYVLVQHLAPAHESLLPEILARETSLPVHEITDAINIAPNHVYIIPENKVLTVYDGKLRLDPRDKGNKLNLVIDQFFNSLAEVHQGFARGVVLSGTGFDGTLGLKTIKEMGGATIVQSPDSAAFEGMPLSAIRAGAADFVIEAEAIPEKLRHINNAYLSSNAYGGDGELNKNGDDFYKHIIKLLRQKTGNDFSHYKQATIRRRLARRLAITKKEDPLTYLEHLRSSTEEQAALFNDILIPVSYFFRDNSVFELLPETVFPRILSGKIAGDVVRVWVAGCSTGEEAYSIAISLHEFLRENKPEVKVQVFATDISENVIAKARTGIYSKLEVQNISDPRLQNYFTKIESAYHIKKEIRDMCVFAVHNFTKDPPFAKMDLVTCRNVLIYLDPFLQKKTFSTFHYSLRTHGVLLLGKSETVSHGANFFEQLVKNQKIYTRKNTVDNVVPSPYERFEPIMADNYIDIRKKSFEPDFQRKANELLFLQYTPPGVIINSNKDIVHFHGETGQFLSQPPGKPNYNIFKMLRSELVFELRTALLKVKANHKPFIKEHLILKEYKFLINLELIPLEEKGGEGHTLILFHKIAGIPEEKIYASRKDAQSEKIRQLEAEIEQMRTDIRKVSEDQEIANEELQSANEELLSNSEELQTLNEELETSTEELRSNNEELTTINDELIDRQEQLTAARLYAEAIIQTIHEPLVILDKDFSIKSANSAFYKFIQAGEHETEGKNIFDLDEVRWQIGNLKAELLNALQEKLTIEELEVKLKLGDKTERTMILNIRPVLNDGLGEPLLLLALEDITEIRAANIALEYNNRELLESNREITSFSYIASHDLQEPLRKIHTFSKMVLKDTESQLSEESATYLERIMVSIRRMRQLTDDLLKYSHLSTTDENEFESTDLTALANEVTEEVSETILTTNANITISDLPIIRANPLLMRQLFINLVSNALKYKSPDKKPEISISSSVAGKDEISGAADTGYYKIKVTDNGIGFLQEQSRQIFEPFQRLHGKDKFEGTGIGLAICNKIVFKHKGFITAESTPGEGATFNVFLPLS